MPDTSHADFDPALVEQGVRAFAAVNGTAQTYDAIRPEMREAYRQHVLAVLTAVAPTLRAEGAAEVAGRLRDLTSRLGFGDGITELQADNDTVVAWFDGCRREADEWRESQRWREGCALAGHPDDEDCYEHDPQFAYQRGMVEGGNRVLAAVKAAVPGQTVVAAREAVARIEGGAA